MLHMLKPVEAIGSLKAKPRRQYADVQLAMSSCVKHVILNGMVLVIIKILWIQCYNYCNLLTLFY